MIKSKKTRIWYGLYFLAAAFAIMLLATRSSFLYPCNNWDDANSYFSVGKALFHGKMPYRDVFDQKGMYLYFFYGLCYFVSHTTFLGVFLMEVLFAFADLCGIFSVLCLYIRKSTALVLTPAVLAVCFCSYSFYYGGSAEELCFPFLIWGLFLGLRYFKQDYPEREMSVKTLLFTGGLAGMVANIKFTVLGFFFAWMMMVAFSYLARKKFTGAVKACLWFLLGMLIPFVPWILYFAVRKGLYYWYWGYVYINVFSYSNLNAEGPSFGERIYTLAKILYYVIWKNLIYYVFLIPGFFFGTFCVGKKILSHLFVPALAFFLFLGIYIGGSELPYYALPLAVFTVLGFALIGWIFEALEKLKEEKETKPVATLRVEVYSMYRAYFRQPESFFYEQDAEYILHYLQTEFPEQEFLHRIEMLSDLLSYDASIQQSAEERKTLYQKVLYLMNYLDTHSDTFSFDRRRKIAEIKGLICP